MRTSAEFKKVDEYELAITVSMPVREWKSLRQQMDDGKWPACDLVQQIREAVNRAEAKVYVPVPDEP